MIVRNLATLTILATLISGCASFGLGTKKVQVITKPVQIEIMQPSLPREISLVEPQWYVVSEAKIANPCLKNEEGKRDCTLGKENPDWPEGYTYLDRFMDDMRKQNGGKVVFVATTIGDYEAMSANMQELRRYIRELGEVIIYYREVTMPNGDKGVGVAIEKKD
jgi:hypothetical protein